MTNTNSTLSLEAAHSLLGSKTRCQVVTYLLEVGGEWDVETLATELVRLDHTVAPEEDDIEAEATRLTTRLYHASLPKLADEAVVEFDTDAMTVAPGENLSTLGDHLDQSLDYSKASCSLAELAA